MGCSSPGLGRKPAIDRPTDGASVRRSSQDLIRTVPPSPSAPRVRPIPDVAAELASGRRPPAPSATNDVAVDPGALVARAIAILGERPVPKPATMAALPAAAARPPLQG